MGTKVRVLAGTAVRTLMGTVVATKIMQKALPGIIPPTNFRG